ncbi:hypothetical protein A2899_01840 [Candidatus Amesbacteria bacterium RIFCSPLOWO2_01_FULL_49_25]|uniref:Type II secretion system protein GspG C-terminal domain-containing protein n=1 Tax=Candidatus Amesbacteria bacterium RIFCSPHIGHO2_01_FULL_48_32b TaxID=1797253 RepID=A0A1F4YG49_9BACT|nr:MAG: hypothetical protein A2876_01635 [Candidatus Amesbacteria bacterium RIFCSPHIGHO2_01_FULL_48_32b]OGD08327.1 MAG: hypothetical protein A2899_01840 [Candidatus Amesbacteria bacterium RIFCSPLOWO2_01_FULL_49_25]
MGFSILDWEKSDLSFVCGVVLVVAVVSMFQLRISAMKTRDAQRKSDISLVARALKGYYGDHKTYPASDMGRIVACGEYKNEVCEWGEDKIADADEVVYLGRMPQDPFAARKWYYRYESGENSFRVYVALEYQGDRERRRDLTVECGPRVQCNWYVE